MKRDVPNKGDLKLRTKYSLKVMLMKTGNEVSASFKKRIFIAKKIFNPRQNFVEMTQ